MRSVEGQAPEASRGTETSFPESFKYGFHRRIIKKNSLPTCKLRYRRAIDHILSVDDRVFVCPSVDDYPFICLSVVDYPFVCLSVVDYAFVCLSVVDYAFVCLSVCPSLIMRLSLCPSLVNRLSVCPLAISLNIQDGDLILI